jgi:signal peptidase II
MKSSSFLHWAQVAAWSVLILALDLVTKRQAVSTWKSSPWEPFDWFQFTYSENTGIAFGLPVGGWFLIMITLALVVGFVIYVTLELDLTRRFDRMTTALILAGALGNFWDRLTLGYVRDFIQIGWWPTFNVADSAICIGFALLLIHLYSSPDASRR